MFEAQDLKFWEAAREMQAWCTDQHLLPKIHSIYCWFHPTLNTIAFCLCLIHFWYELLKCLFFRTASNYERHDNEQAYWHLCRSSLNGDRSYYKQIEGIGDFNIEWRCWLCQPEIYLSSINLATAPSFHKLWKSKGSVNNGLMYWGHRRNGTSWKSPSAFSCCLCFRFVDSMSTQFRFISYLSLPITCFSRAPWLSFCGRIGDTKFEHAGESASGGEHPLSCSRTSQTMNLADPKLSDYEKAFCLSAACHAGKLWRVLAAQQLGSSDHLLCGQKSVARATCCALGRSSASTTCAPIRAGRVFSFTSGTARFHGLRCLCSICARENWQIRNSDVAKKSRRCRWQIKEAVTTWLIILCDHVKPYWNIEQRSDRSGAEQGGSSWQLWRTGGWLSTERRKKEVCFPILLLRNHHDILSVFERWGDERWTLARFLSR